MKLVIQIKPDGNSIYQLFEKEPDLETLQKMVEGYIQMVPNWPRFANMSCEVYANEDGLYKNMDYNTEATNLWRKYLDSTGQEYDRGMATLVGPVVLVCEIN
jgi:oligoendopeptidase F